MNGRPVPWLPAAAIRAVRQPAYNLWREADGFELTLILASSVRECMSQSISLRLACA